MISAESTQTGRIGACWTTKENRSLMDHQGQLVKNIKAYILSAHAKIDKTNALKRVRTFTKYLLQIICFP